MEQYPTTGILVEAEAFDNYGGWTLDSQFELEMGSPYLLAHGLGKAVADATTIVTLPKETKFHIWVRTKDWVPRHHPGRFTLSYNNFVIGEFGASGKEGWCWQYGGTTKVKKEKAPLVLHDLTGFGARCDAIFFTKEKGEPPNVANDAMRKWRKRLLGLPDQPEDAGPYDVVVVGGGIVGAAAVLTSARLGNRVALVHNRPILGGNGSVECGLRPRGITGPLIDEIAERHPSGDIKALSLLKAEPNVKVFLEHCVFDAVTSGSKILSVDARHARSGKEIRLSAPVFIDCSGRVTLGLLAGAETLSGQESHGDYGESLAPAEADHHHHGNTMFFRTRMADKSVSFPEVPWATEVAKDFSNLGGQLVKPGIDNGEGPVVKPPGPDVRRRMKLPATHFWEYGQDMDMYTQGEEIRDHLLRAIFGTFSNVKRMKPEKYRNLQFDHVAFVAATGEFKRYRGDYILTETDIRSHQQFEDAVVQNGGAFCLHYSGHEHYDFRLKDWKWDERDGKDYDIPFRCLYSSNIDNLMMAGKHISVTHVAGSNTKFMGNGGQHAIATAAAASLCKKYSITPRQVREQHMAELREVARSITGRKLDGNRSRL